MDRRTFLAAGAATAGAPRLLATARPRGADSTTPLSDAGGAAQDFELADATLDQLQAWQAEGRYSAQRLTELYLERIATLDRRGPTLRSVLETNPDAPAIAAERDAERRAGRVRGSLHGIPVLLKDNIDTADRNHTSAGSLALEGSIALRDAGLATRLRAAGAVLLGKANLSEWANIRANRSSSGWSGRGGQCRNPYALDRSPSGSSSGSAAAAAASLCAVAVGTETDGSITSPGSACGLVGVKPTVGLVSRAGVIPISHTQDTAGPLARTVRDAALLLAAMAGEDPRDRATAGADARATGLLEHLRPDALRGARLGVARKRYTGYHRLVDRLFDEALAVLRDQGAVIVDPADVPTEDHLGDAELEVLLYELKADLNAYLATLGPAAPVRTLAEVIAFNTRNADREMPYFRQELFERAEALGPLTAAPYRAALATCRRWSRTLGLDAVLSRHRLDAIVCPTQGPVWPIDLVNGDSFGGNCTTPAAVAGYPHVTVPMGFAFGLPVGLSFMGRAWSDARLLGLCHAYELASRMRRAPRFAGTAEVPA